MSAAVDTLGFVAAVEGLPEQFDAALRRAPADVGAVPVPERITSLVVCGMGAAGFVGDAVATATSAVAPVPVTVLRQMRIPAFVGPETLVLAVSYTGETEETRSMATNALDAGARVVALSTGGPLARLVRERGATHLPLVPGIVAERAALGALVVPTFLLLERMGLAPGATEWLTGAAATLATRRDACRSEVTAPRNPARELARRIGRTFPLVYGTGQLGAVAAARWKADVNANAKAPAFWNTYPALDHDEICGWGQHGDVTRQLLTLVELRHGHEHAVLGPRVAATREIVEETVHQVLEVRAEGSSRLAQLLDLVYVGTWVSVYLALDAGVDPGPVDAVTRLESVLTGG
jgi:glucose/mannose-6-phosphate isomerase